MCRVEENIGLVRFILKKKFNGGHRIAQFYRIEVEDLVQAGSIGLIKADQRFDEAFGVKFITYATSMIYGAIRHYLRDQQSSLTAKFARCVREVSKNLTTEDTIETIIEKKGVSYHMAHEVYDYLNRGMYSIHHPYNSEESFTLEEVFVSEEEGYDKIIREIELQERLALLDQRRRQIMILLMEGHTQQEVANIIGVTQVQISRLMRQSVEIINNNYGDKPVMKKQKVTRKVAV